MEHNKNIKCGRRIRKEKGDKKLRADFLIESVLCCAQFFVYSHLNFVSAITIIMMIHSKFIFSHSHSR